MVLASQELGRNFMFLLISKLHTKVSCAFCCYKHCIVQQPNGNLCHLLYFIITFLALDPHGKGKQCVDVSTYTFPTWVKQDKKCCKTIFKKKIIPRQENVSKVISRDQSGSVTFSKCFQSFIKPFQEFMK